MKREDIIRMAEEAGLCWRESDDRICPDTLGAGDFIKFAQLVAAHEREECALLCRDEAHKQQTMDRGIACAELAQKIRART